MMIKYRVHEVAKDLNVPNKFVIEQLQKHCDTTKKYMTALTEDELDVVLDSFTQERELASRTNILPTTSPTQAPGCGGCSPAGGTPAGSKAAEPAGQKSRWSKGRPEQRPVPAAEKAL